MVRKDTKGLMATSTISLTSLAISVLNNYKCLKFAVGDLDW